MLRDIAQARRHWMFHFLRAYYNIMLIYHFPDMAKLNLQTQIEI